MAKKTLTSKERETSASFSMSPQSELGGGGRILLASESEQNYINLPKDFFLTNVVKKRDLKGRTIYSYTIMKGKGPRDQNAEFYGDRSVFAKNRIQVKDIAIKELKHIGEL